MSDTDDNQKNVMLKLLEYEGKTGHAQYADADVIAKMTALKDGDTNDAVELLESNGYLTSREVK